MIINIKGIDVKFPFEPYDLQRNYMEKVIEALQKEQNAVLESPTGNFEIFLKTSITLRNFRNRQNFVPLVLDFSMAS